MNGMKVWVWGAVLGLALLQAPSAWAQDSKVGVVNTERILRESALAKQASQRLEQEFAKRDKELQDTATRLKAMSEKLDRDMPVLNETERVRRQRELAELDKDFQRKQRELREDLNQRRNEEYASIVERSQRVIKQIAEQEKFDLIVQDAMYFSARIDITEKVLRVLNTAAK